MPDATAAVLSRFPKRRPPLPEAYREIYVEHYRRNREGRSTASALSQKMESWMHRMVALDVANSREALSTLEIGAGNLNHLTYEPPSDCYDVVEPLADLVENSPHRSRVARSYRSIQEIHDLQYERIISVAAFEHYCDLPEIVSQCRRLLAPGGQLRVAIPSEGSLLWTLGWKLTTGLEFRIKYGLDYAVLMEHEHVNMAAEIEAVLSAFFGNVRRSVFGIARPLSFYQFFQCTP